MEKLRQELIKKMTLIPRSKISCGDGYYLSDDEEKDNITVEIFEKEGSGSVSKKSENKETLENSYVERDVERGKRELKESQIRGFLNRVISGISDCPNCGSKLFIYLNGSTDTWVLECDALPKQVRKFLDDIIQGKRTDLAFVDNKPESESAEILFRSLTQNNSNKEEDYCLLRIEIKIP